MNKKLGEVCHFYSGTGFPVAYQGKDSGELPFFKVSDIANNVSAGNVHLSVCNNYVSRQEASKLKGTILPKGTVVFAKIGEALKLNRRAITVCDCLVDNNAMGIAPDPDFLREGYFFYFMKKLKLQDHAETTTVPSVRKSKLELINISVPSIEKQEKIERELDKVSAVVQLRQKELQKLDDLIKARFVELFGDPRRNECFKWGLKDFKDITELITDGEHATPRRVNKGIYLLSARNVLNHSLQLTDVDYIDQEEYDRIAKRIIPKEGDVLVSCSGSVGRCCSVPSGIQFQMVRSAALLRFSSFVLPVFAEYMITSDFVQEQINQSKTASSQANLFQGKIAKLKGFVPPIELQEQFATFVAQVDKSKSQIQKSLDETQLLFDSLMQKYFG